MLERRIQGDDRQLLAQPADVLHDAAAESNAHGGDQRQRILGSRGELRQRLADGAQIADRYPLQQQVLQHLDDDAHRQQLRHQILDQFRRALPQAVQQLLCFLVAEEFVSMGLQQVAQVSRDDAAGVHHGVALGLRLLAP